MGVFERLSKIIKMGKFSFIINKFIQWEYWPTYMFYIPNLPYALYLTLKARNFTLYSAINPAIKNSGNGTESKFKTLELIPNKLTPKTIFVPETRNFEKVKVALSKNAIDYPLIAKPDIGFKGLLVKKIHSEKELQHYLNAYPIDLVLQEFINLPNECGVFYHRLPNSDTGRITSFTLKSFLLVTGNGTSTLEELVKCDKRAQHYVSMLKKNHAAKWHSIPEKGEAVRLSDIGNHAKGTQFINGNHLIDQQLTDTFDAISKEIYGWYYGRMDIKYQSIEELKKGENFYILEINGTISEPTELYDPYNASYFKALKLIRQHWDYIYQIGVQNLKNGVPSKSFFTYWKETFGLIAYVKKVSELAKSTS